MKHFSLILIGLLGVAVSVFATGDSVTITLRNGECDQLPYITRVPVNSTIYLHAVADYDFLYWDDDHTLTDPIRLVTATENTTYTAVFAAPTLTIRSTECEGWSYTRNVHLGEQIVISAQSIPGSHLTNWTKTDGTIVSTQAEFLYTITKLSDTLQANYIVVPFTIMNSVCGEPYTVYRSPGETVRLLPQPEDGYRFVRWTDEHGTTLGTASPWDYTIPDEGSTVLAVFEMIGQFHIGTTACPDEIVSYYCPPGTDAILCAVAKEYYRFDYWEDDRSAPNPRQVTSTEEGATYIAHFRPYDYLLTIKVDACSDSAVYYVSPDGNRTVVVQAEAQNAYGFAQWSDGNKENPRAFTLSGDSTITAFFYSRTMEIVGADEDGDCNPVSYPVYRGQKVYLQAEPKTDFIFSHWDNKQDATYHSTENPVLVDIQEVNNFVANYIYDDFGPMLDIVNWDGSNVRLNLTNQSALSAIGASSVYMYTDAPGREGATAVVYANNDDYTITMPYSEASCTNLPIKLYEGETRLSMHRYQVGKAVTTDTDESILAGGCDAYIQNGATLDITADAAARCIYVNAGATLRVEPGVTLTVDSLVIRSMQDEQPNVEIQGDGTIHVGQRFVFAKQVDNLRSYITAVPYVLNHDDAYYAYGASAASKLRTSSYNSQRRAEWGMSPNNWTPTTGMLNATQGYEWTTNTRRYREFRYLLSGTVDLTAMSGATTVYAYEGGDEEDAGWNLIGLPYLCAKPVGSALRLGENADIYVSLPNPDGYTYTQSLSSEVTIPAFMGFLVQTAAQQELSMPNPYSDLQHAAPHRAAGTDIDESRLNLWLSNASGDDHLGLRIASYYGEQYEIGADLIKMLGHAALPQVYAVHAAQQLAYIATHPHHAEQGIHVGVYLPAETNYIFRLGEADDLSMYEHVYLTDLRLAQTIDLLYQDYYFSGQGTDESRFILAAIRRPVVDNTDVATGTNEPTRSNWNAYQQGMHIVVAGLCEEAAIRMYDAAGRLLYDGTEHVLSVPASGVYLVEAVIEGKRDINRVVIR